VGAGVGIDLGTRGVAAMPVSYYMIRLQADTPPEKENLMLFKHDIVRYKDPMPDEIGITYKVLEVNGDRVIIQADVNLPIPPTTIANTKDLEKC
jgi:hypothetical protein